MKMTVAQEWLAHTTMFLQWADACSAEQLAQRPTEGKWSVFEHLEHIFVAEKGAARIMQGPSEPEERDLEAARARMGKWLTDLSAKYAGGNSLDPKGRFQNYDEWRTAFVANRDAMLQSAESLGYDERCTAFPHPYFGQLTRAEWLIFNTQHADRHLAQMQAFIQ